MNQQKIGSFIRELRKEQNITQEQLAEQFNISARTISRWETGHNMPDISLLIEISEFFDVSIPEIINGERKSETMNEEVKEVAEKLSDYAGEEKINMIKNVRNLSVVGVVAVIISYILESTGVASQSGFPSKIFLYCETLVPVTVIMIAFYSTGLMNKLHRKSKSSVLDNFPKAIRIIITAVLAFAVAALLKLFLVKVLGL